MARVFVSRQFALDLHHVRGAIEEGCVALGGADALLRGVDRVLVKPNFAVSRNPEKAITNPLLVEAVLGLLKDHGVADIAVGEGCGGTGKAQAVFDVTGLTGIAPRYGARLVDLNEAEQVSRPVPDGYLLETVHVAREAAECDLIVNLPTMKTHLSTVISIAMKNLKGVLNWPSKRSFHQRGLFRCIVDLNRLPWRQLVVVDGTRAMEGWGPFDGDLVLVDRVVMTREALAADIVCAQIMGFVPADIDTIRLAREAGLGSGEPEVVGESVAAIRAALGRPFQAPPLRQVLDLGYAQLHVGGTACTGCLGQASGISLVLKQRPDLPAGQRPHFCVGNALPGPAALDEVVVHWGSCAVRAARAAGVQESSRCLFLPGCPPDPHAVQAAVERVTQVLAD